jgi:hypothetical protein
MLYKQLLPLNLAFVLACCSQVPSASAQFDDLLRRVPPGANAIVAIDVDAVHASPLAVRERWKENYENEYITRSLILPPEAKRIVLAAHLDAQADLESRWELAVMDTSEPISMRSIARAEGGYTDTINSLPAAWIPSNSYFVELASNTLGMMYPANRQYVSRWANFGKENVGVKVSDYLHVASKSVGKSGQIVLAVDLTDAPRPHVLRETLEMSEAVANAKNVDLDALSDVLMSLKGVTMSVDIQDKRLGRIDVHFGRDVGMMSSFAKPLLLEALESFGAGIEDLNHWRPSVSYDTISLEGELSPEAMRKVFSILEMPSTKFSTEDEQSIEETSKEKTIKASKKYFDGVLVYLDDLVKASKDYPHTQGTWMHRYARKIDRMPILHVDEDLLVYGTDVAESFRGMAVARQSAGVRKGVRKAQGGSYGNYRYGSYGNRRGRRGGGRNYGYTANRIRIDKEEAARASKVKLDSWGAIQTQTAQIRQTMTKRYEVEF